MAVHARTDTIESLREQVAALQALDESRRTADAHARAEIMRESQARHDALVVERDSLRRSLECLRGQVPTTAAKDLPPELLTPAWVAAFASLNFSNPAESIRDDDLCIRVTPDGWAADFRRFFPCCRVGGDQIQVDARNLEAIALAITEVCKHGDPRCPNARDHSRLR